MSTPDLEMAKTSLLGQPVRVPKEGSCSQPEVGPKDGCRPRVPTMDQVAQCVTCGVEMPQLTALLFAVGKVSGNLSSVATGELQQACDSLHPLVEKTKRALEQLKQLMRPIRDSKHWNHALLLMHSKKEKTEDVKSCAKSAMEHNKDWEREILQLSVELESLIAAWRKLIVELTSADTTLSQELQKADAAIQWGKDMDRLGRWFLGSLVAVTLIGYGCYHRLPSLTVGEGHEVELHHAHALATAPGPSPMPPSSLPVSPSAFLTVVAAEITSGAAALAMLDYQSAGALTAKWQEYRDVKTKLPGAIEDVRLVQGMLVNMHHFAKKEVGEMEVMTDKLEEYDQALGQAVCDLSESHMSLWTRDGFMKKLDGAHLEDWTLDEAVKDMMTYLGALTPEDCDVLISFMTEETKRADTMRTDLGAWIKGSLDLLDSILSLQLNMKKKAERMRKEQPRGVSSLETK